MEFNIEVRKKQLQSLKQYISSSEENVRSVLQSLGWTAKRTLEAEAPKVTCSINKNHLINFNTSEDHIKNCQLSTLGYKLDDTFLSEPPDVNNGSTIKLDSKIKIDVLYNAKVVNNNFKAIWNGLETYPMTSDRLMSTFSTDERLAIYDYCVKNTQGPRKPQEFTLDLPASKSTKELTEKEKLSLERDAKRRRIKYKSVHTSKKSQTEVIREVINNQMELYEQWIKQKQKEEKKEKEKAKLEMEKKELSAVNENKDYQYIPTIYQGQTENNMTQWGQYSGTYENQYQDNIGASQNTITDWSHVYQGVVDTNITVEPSQYQYGELQYPETMTAANTQSYSNISVDMPPNSCNGYSSAYSKSYNNTNVVGSNEPLRNWTYNNHSSELYSKETLSDTISYDRGNSNNSRYKDIERKYEREKRKH